MKSKICFICLVMMLSVVRLSAQDKAPTYVIDGKVVSNFDGSQLKGVKIIDYTVDDKTNKHTITTNKMPARVEPRKTSGTIKMKVRGDDAKVGYILDGKIITKDEMEKIDMRKIFSMEVVKNASDPRVKKYASEDVDAFILITTKK